MTLMELLPEYYENSVETKRLQEAFQHWIDMIENYKEDILLQLNVSTATWGLEKWEEQYGIVTDNTKSIEFRRERVKAKVRGTGTITKHLIIDVAKAYSNGEVDVIEDTSNYSFKIKFVGTKGLPPNMADLKITIDEIKPAHLTYTFEYVYRTHNELRSYTNNTLQSYTHNQLREGVMN